jgi:hypothetical protein
LAAVEPSDGTRLPELFEVCLKWPTSHQHR